MRFSLQHLAYTLQVISFKWLARHFSIPADAAKRLLFEFTEGHKDKISATYLISGWTKASQPQHTVELVDAKALAQRRSKLDPVTSLHVYSVQPVQPRVLPARKYYLLISCREIRCHHLFLVVMSGLWRI